MIPCGRSFIRVNRCWNSANSRSISINSPHLFQGCNGYRILSCSMAPPKNHKASKPVWRPISTQSTASHSHQGTPVKNVSTQSDASASEAGVQVQVVHSTHPPQVQDSSKKVKTDSSGVEVQVRVIQPSEDDSLNQEITNGTVTDKQGLVDDKDQSVQLVNQGERHSISVEVSASLIRFLKGKSGSTHKQIEQETGAKIIFPSSRLANSVVIEGTSVESITRASEKIQVILEEAVKSPSLDYSHFISLPLALHPELVDKLINFQNAILGITDSGKDDQLSSESDGETSDETDNNDQQLDGGKLKVEDEKEEIKTEIKKIHSVSDQDLDGGELKVEDEKEEVKTEIRKIQVVSNQQLDGGRLKLEDEKDDIKTEMKKIHVVSYPPKASKSSKLSGNYDLGIEKSIFIKPKTFHLTVLMLKLWNNERVTAAAEVLQRVSTKVMDALEGRPVSVRLKGLESMRGPLAKARVLYTPVEVVGGEDRLLHACQIITDAYIEAGLVLEKDAHQKLKLHGTVMNARHRKRNKGKKGFSSFDARNIVEQYGSEDWGEYIIPEVHLSQRFMFDENGYYHCCSSIPFPKTD